MGKIAAAWAAMSSAARAVAIGGLACRSSWSWRWRRSRSAARVDEWHARPRHRLGRGTAVRRTAERLALAVDCSASPFASPSGRRVPPPAAADPLLGTDGRLTVLLLGTDYRPAHPGNRTDAIMVVSVDPTTGRPPAFSVPRDVVDFPLAGRRHVRAQGQRPVPVPAVDETNRGAANMMAAFERAFDIEIDNYVFIGFPGVTQLVGAVGGVDVRLEKAYYDPLLLGERPSPRLGPAGRQEPPQRSARADLRPQPEGRQRLRSCPPPAAARDRRVRPRSASAASTTSRSSSRLPATPFEPICRSIPRRTCSSSTSRWSSTRSKKVVFGPKTYAVRATGYDYHLVYSRCKAWIKKYFPKERPFGTWPARRPPAGSVPPSQAPARRAERRGARPLLRLPPRDGCALRRRPTGTSRRGPGRRSSRIHPTIFGLRRSSMV